MLKISRTILTVVLFFSFCLAPITASAARANDELGATTDHSIPLVKGGKLLQIAFNADQKNRAERVAEAFIKEGWVNTPIHKEKADIRISIHAVDTFLSFYKYHENGSCFMELSSVSGPDEYIIKSVLNAVRTYKSP